MASISYRLSTWAEGESQFKVLCGEAGFILDRNPSLVVGIDVAVTHRKPRADRHSETTLVEGPPHIAVEILSPSDSHGDVHEKLRIYLDHGVAAVWIVDPDDQSVRIYRPGQPVTLFSGDQVLNCEPEMPGFAVKTRLLFQ
jgi:Uma2 family endonuclease